MALFYNEHGSVSRREYERLKAGDSRFPSVKVIITLFGGLRSSLAIVGDNSRTQLLWTREEDDFLRERAGTMTIRTMARRLRRSYLATRHRMFHLRISHKDNDGRLTAKELANELGIHPDTVVRRVRKGTYKGQLVSGVWRISDPRESVDSESNLDD